MNTKKRNIFTIVIAVLVVLVGGLYILSLQEHTSTPVAKGGEYNELAQCIADSGTIFYGAFWCPHCQDQKEEFGSAAELLPYIECSSPNGKDQLAVCSDAGVESYPTWLFSDGSRLTGTQSLETLSEKTNCPLPTLTQ